MPMTQGMGLMPAAEGPFPIYNGAPADQQPLDLPGALALVDSIIWRDGGMDQNEQRIWGAWVQQTIMKAQAQAQTQQAGLGTQQGIGESSAGLDNPNAGGGFGTEMEADEDAGY